MIKVKFNETNSKNIHEKTFDNYEDFEYWFCKLGIKIIIHDIKKEG